MSTARVLSGQSAGQSTSVSNRMPDSAWWDPATAEQLNGDAGVGDPT
jgi:hypothetical protein